MHKVRVVGMIRPRVRFQKGVFGRVEWKFWYGLKKPIFSTSRMCQAGCATHRTVEETWARRRLRDARVGRPFLVAPWAGSGAARTVVTENDGEQESNVETEESPEGEESDTRSLHAPVRALVFWLKSKWVWLVCYPLFFVCAPDTLTWLLASRVHGRANGCGSSRYCSYRKPRGNLGKYVAQTRMRKAIVDSNTPTGELSYF